jgi:hypothetical protein
VLVPEQGQEPVLVPEQGQERESVPELELELHRQTNYLRVPSK